MSPKKHNSIMYIGIAITLILLGIIATAIINNVKDRQSQDIRARASGTTSVNTLKFTGIVKEVHESEGIIVVDNVAFSKESSSGDIKNYGTWSVSPPAQFAIKTLKAGNQIRFTVETSTFNVASRTVVATQLTVL
jgi:hypothetical protein